MGWSLTVLAEFVWYLVVYHFTFVRLNTCAYNTYIRNPLLVMNTQYFFFKLHKDALQNQADGICMLFTSTKLFYDLRSGISRKKFVIDIHKYGLISYIYLTYTSILHVSIT